MKREPLALKKVRERYEHSLQLLHGRVDRMCEVQLRKMVAKLPRHIHPTVIMFGNGDYFVKGPDVTGRDEDNDLVTYRLDDVFSSWCENARSLLSERAAMQVNNIIALLIWWVDTTGGPSDMGFEPLKEE